ncbi:hypothetical protein T484DRAFT_1843028, partial [Baffinella frigidus]
QALPAGWIKQWDLAQQRFFYINSNLAPPALQRFFYINSNLAPPARQWDPPTVADA